MAKIAKAVGRSVKEWIGKTADSRPPKHVELRIFDRAEGRCHITGRKIAAGDRWEVEHVKRLDDGGENRESNLAPALVDPHKIKSAEERARAARADQLKASHLGLNDEPRHPMRSRVKEPKAKTEKPPLTKIAVGASAIARRFGLKG